MHQSAPWLSLLVILLGALILRQPQLQNLEDRFLSWALHNSKVVLPAAPITLIEMSRHDFPQLTAADRNKEPDKASPGPLGPSPIDYALFLRAVLEFHPVVVALEPVISWRERDKDQAQVFIDQAMRVPKLLVGIELGGKGKENISAEDVPSFSQVSQERAGLAQFTGISRRPDDEIRLISTPGFINLPNEQNGLTRAPMLFVYRGAIVPSFALEAILLWLRATPAEVKVELGSEIVLPNGWKIPIHSDGTMTINPLAENSVRRHTVGQLLLAAEERETHRPPTIDFANLKDQIVLLRISDDRLPSPDVFATAIATILNNACVRRAHSAFGWIVVLGGALLACFLWQISKWDLVMGAIGFSAGYVLVALGILSKTSIWLPTFLPLSLLWLLVIVRLFAPASSTNFSRPRAI